MWWFKKKIKTPEANTSDSILSASQDESVNTQIPKEKFILEETPSVINSELPIYEIYKRFQEDWETKGYNDAVCFPDTTYRDNQKNVIIDQLRLAIKEAILRYDDKLVDIEVLIGQIQRNGLMETYDKYIQERKKLVAHRDELAILDKDVEDIGEKTKPIFISYDMGFTRGIVSLSDEKISKIMNK